METVIILRELWRRRLLVAMVAALAVFVGLALTFRPTLPPESRKYEVGLASARILVDTPNSQVVEVSPKGSETLGERASLLANLMTEGEVNQAIAKRAGLAPGRLVSLSETAGEPSAPPPNADTSARGHILTTRLVTNAAGDPLPIIELEAQAPTVAEAARLATAAVGGLNTYLDSKAAVEKVPDARRLRVTGLGIPQAREAVRGPRRVVAIGAALFVFLLGCAAILIVSGIARSWRAASQQEQDDRDLDAPAPPQPEQLDLTPAPLPRRTALSATDLGDPAELDDPAGLADPPDLGDKRRTSAGTEARASVS